MTQEMREKLGRMVRDAWVAWARTRPDAKPHWLLPWEELSEPDREVDRQIGERLFGVGLDCAKAVCAQRGENERTYDSAGHGERHAAAYDRAEEDIDRFRQTGRLEPLGGAYAGAGQPIRNPLHD